MSEYLITKDELIRDYYDPSDPASVLSYAKQLLGGTLRPHLTPEQILYALSRDDKGDFGNLLEEGYFKVKNNNISEPDIPESGIEIKSGQLKRDKGSRLSLKERMKVSMIDYNGSFQSKDLLSSSLWPKLDRILLLLFMRDSSGVRIDEECKYSDILTWSDDDKKQMSADWAHIKDMVVNGRADQISEGHTWYLGACTAGANAAALRQAPGGVMAKTRAFSLKSSYLNYKLGYTSELKKGAKLLVFTPSFGTNLDEYIINNMKHFIGKPREELARYVKRSDLLFTKAKNVNSLVARALLVEITGKHSTDNSFDFDQFRKAGVIERTVTLEHTGYLKESTSFPAFKWIELDQEEVWEDSELYVLMTTKFFFTVFQKSPTSTPIFKGSFFWTMPSEDVEKMKVIWLDTKSKVRAGVYDRFIAIADHHIGHVRPHTNKGPDINPEKNTFPTPQGGVVGKQSFWLSNHYVRRVMRRELGI